MATGQTIYVKRTTESQPSVTPKVLKFLVTINNQMPRVFHGAGTVVQFNVGGHLIPVDQRAYAGLQEAIIPPQSEQQVEIFGPPLDKLPPGQNSLTLFFYDVVTAQSDAGVVTEKQNYHWDYTLKMNPTPTQMPAPTVETVQMTPQEFQTEQAQATLRQAGVMIDPSGRPVPMGMRTSPQ